ncbi:MAG: DUF1318 domain-containing protein [Rhodospirillaceae bacterium]
MTKAPRLFAAFAPLALGLVALLAIPASPAHAISLNEARSAGLVCEGPDGLIRKTGGGGDVDALVNATNAQRMAVYQNSASSEGVPVNQIQAVSGAKLRQSHRPC